MRKAYLAIGLGFLTGCAASKAYVAKDYVFTGKVAVLPMANNSNDLDGPVFVRSLIFDGLAARHYEVLPIPQIDNQLKTQGFTDGGQLGATTPQKLGEWTGADTVLYSTLENFDYINVGFYAERRVKIIARLFNARTGEKLWEAEREGASRVFVADKKAAEQEFAVQLAAKAAEKMTHRPLQRESQMAVAELLNALPNRH